MLSQKNRKKLYEIILTRPEIAACLFSVKAMISNYGFQSLVPNSFTSISSMHRGTLQFVGSLDIDFSFLNRLCLPWGQIHRDSQRLNPWIQAAVAGGKLMGQRSMAVSEGLPATSARSLVSFSLTEEQPTITGWWSVLPFENPSHFVPPSHAVPWCINHFPWCTLLERRRHRSWISRK